MVDNLHVIVYYHIIDWSFEVLEISVCQGDISRFEAEAVVNAANNHFWMGAGVAGALKRAGGPEIEDEAVKKGPVPVGQVVVTGGGRLKAKYVIHAAVMGQDLRTDAEKIRLSTRKSLLCADEIGISSIAFPALGTGVGGFPMVECARIMLGEALKYGPHHTKLQHVTFVLYEESAYRIFKAELEMLNKA